MPALNFSAPNLAIVAYAEVDGATGASTRLNSGVVVSRVGMGGYLVLLPTNLNVTENQDLIFVQPKNNAGGSGVVAKSFVIQDAFASGKNIIFFDGSPVGTETRIDSTFFILILRTTITPPVGAPA